MDNRQNEQEERKNDEMKGQRQLFDTKSIARQNDEAK